MIFSVFQEIRVLGYSGSTLLWYRCYSPHRSRDALSPVYGIFYSINNQIHFVSRLLQKHVVFVGDGSIYIADIKCSLFDFLTLGLCKYILIGKDKIFVLKLSTKRQKLDQKRLELRTSENQTKKKKKKCQSQCPSVCVSVWLCHCPRCWWSSAIRGWK